MKTERFAVALTIIDLALTVFLLAQLRRAMAGGLTISQKPGPVLRGRALKLWIQMDPCARASTMLTVVTVFRRTRPAAL